MHAFSLSIMNHMERAHPKRLTLHLLAQNKPASITAQRGTVVACLSGELWVTQAGDLRDYLVPRGYRYCSSENGLIVVNSLNGLSHALVYWREPDHCADFVRNSVHIDHESTQRLIQHAHTLRQKTMGHAARRLRRRLASTWRLFMNRCFHASLI